MPVPKMKPEQTGQRANLEHLTNLLYRKIVERTKCPQDQYREAYRLFGSPSNGIFFPDFYHHVNKLGLLLSVEDAKRLFDKFDLDGNGFVDFRGMVAAVMPSDYHYDTWGVAQNYRSVSCHLLLHFEYRLF